MMGSYFKNSFSDYEIYMYCRKTGKYSKLIRRNQIIISFVFLYLSS